MFILNRADHNNPDLTQLNKTINNLKEFLNGRFDFDDEDWNNQLNLIVNHQSGDGTFRIVDSFRIPADARFNFCNYPTVLCNAILMKTILLSPDKYDWLLPILSKGLDASAKMGIEGHGYDCLSGQFEFIEIYYRAGLPFFLDKYPETSESFSAAIGEIKVFYSTCIERENYIHDFNNNYEEQIKSTLEKLTRKPIFVYGTLMTSERNHHFIEDQLMLKSASICGYNLYNLGLYPGIRPSKHDDHIVKGEIYLVNETALKRINRLEDEGSLYLLKCAEACARESRIIVGAYVYNHKANKETRIESGDWKERN